MRCLVSLDPDGYGRAAHLQGWHHFQIITNISFFLLLINQYGWSVVGLAELHWKTERTASDFSVGLIVRMCSSLARSEENGW